MLKIDKIALKVLEVLNSNGYEAFLVGGCVRDLLLNKEPFDYDITTNATPSQVKEVFKSYKVIDINSKHGTTIVHIDHIPFEITTYRLETTYSDHRRPDKVTFSKTLNEDLKRRDFTINALAYNPKTGIIDLHNGIDDLNNKVIRCINDPNVRFNEDALRILRAIRFSSQLHFTIEEKTKESILKNKDLLNYISIERIYIEFIKILQSDNPLEILNEYQQVISIFLPEIKKYPLQLNNISKKPSFLLACLLLNINNPKAILKRLHVDNKTLNECLLLIENYSLFDQIDDLKIKKALITFGYDNFFSLLDFYSQINNIDTTLLKDKSYKIYKNIKIFKINELQINGNDLLENNIPSKEIGNVLEELFNLVVEEKIENKYDSLINYVKENDL